MLQATTRPLILSLGLLLGLCNGPLRAQEDNKTLRVFLFAGQSNMVGADSKAKDIERFPPFAGLDKAQSGVKFWYCNGRDKKTRSKGWVDLQPIGKLVDGET